MSAPRLALYPLHEVIGEADPKTGKRPASTYHPYLALPETIGIVPPKNGFHHLFCPACAALVVVTAELRAQAERAAEAEGVGEIKIGNATPGSLSEEVRASLFAAYRVPGLAAEVERLKSDRAVLRHRRGKSTIDKAEATLNKAKNAALKGATLAHHLGYFEAADAIALTPAGFALAKSLVDPEVPTMLPVDPEWAAKHRADVAAADKEARRAKRVRVAVSVPMVCTCDHGVKEHLTAGKSKDPCGVADCKCLGYVQVTAKRLARKAKLAATVAA